MSLFALSIVSSYPQLSLNLRGLAYELAEIESGGICSPTIEYLAKRADTSERAIQRAIRKLEEIGIIQVIPQFNNGKQLPNKYKFIGGDINDTPSFPSDLFEAESRFDDWWSLYPVKKGKQTAKKSWDKQCLDQKADDLIAVLQNQIQHDDQWKKGIGIPHPASYLNQARWEDQVIHKVNGADQWLAEELEKDNVIDGVFHHAP